MFRNILSPDFNVFKFETKGSCHGFPLSKKVTMLVKQHRICQGAEHDKVGFVLYL